MQASSVGIFTQLADANFHAYNPQAITLLMMTDITVNVQLIFYGSCTINLPRICYTVPRCIWKDKKETKKKKKEISGLQDQLV